MTDEAPSDMVPDQNASRARAHESVALKFSRVMKASTSRFGLLTDPPIVALSTALFLVVDLGALRLGATGVATYVLGVLVGLPIVVAVIVTLRLSGARERIVDWLSRVPFPVENMNAVLNGVGELIEIQFEEAGPTSAAMNANIERIHPDAFVTEAREDARVMEVRIGVIDSKRNPARSNHERYVRVVRIVNEVLVPLAQRTPITAVRIR